MKKIILFFTAVVIMVTAAFAVDHEPWEDQNMCQWRDKEGMPALLNCEHLLTLGQYSSNTQCCFKYPICHNAQSLGLPSCESKLEAGQNIMLSWCCWKSRENIRLLKVTGDGEGNKKASHKAPKNKKGKTVQPVKVNSTKVKVQTKTTEKNSK